MVPRADVQLDSQFSAVKRIWQGNRCMTSSSIDIYCRWVERFKEYCRIKGLEESSQLTLTSVIIFARWYAHFHDIQTKNSISIARSSLKNWAYALQVLGEKLPSWDKEVASPCLQSKLLRDFTIYLRELRENLPQTIHKKIRHITDFLTYLRKKRRRPERVRLQDIDDYVLLCCQRYARRTTSDICSSLRGFSRFLLVSGRLSVDIAASIIAPRIRRDERPHRTLPWADVRRILQAVDRQSPCGHRDYALLLMMSMYGLGAGEIINLTLDDIDWSAATLHVTRPKNSAEYHLPLMPSVARALVSYLRYGRPVHAQTRRLFVTMIVPHKPLACSVTIRHILHTHAKQAGVEADYLGTHVLRHTHACRLLELGTPPKLIGDILGHRNPASTSSYLRVSKERLRELALPVPS